MKTVIKNVLLGSVAGLAMVGTAAAADLPVKAKPAEYVKICSTYGAGYYYIPGTDTCLKVGGYIKADTYVQSFDQDYSNTQTFARGQFTFNGNPVGNPLVLDDAIVTDEFKHDDTETYFETRAALQMDARTQTEYGTLRSYFEARFQYGRSYDNDYTGGMNGSNFSLKYAYIQFAGFTFGKATSQFDFWAGDFYEGIDPGFFYADATPNQIAYTADFGNGFSASISIEDAYERSGNYTDVDDNQIGQQVPDIVGNITYEGSWGAAKVSGAAHQNEQDPSDDVFGFSNTAFAYNNGGFQNDDWGWAVLGGVRFDFSETTNLYIEGVYSDGAVGYTGLGVAIPLANTDFDGDSIAAWYVGGGIRHYWTPTVFTSLVGSYGETDDFTLGYAQAVPVLGSITGVANANYQAYSIGANIGWQPVKGLTLVLQYDRIQEKLDYDYATADSYNFPGPGGLDLVTEGHGKMETTSDRFMFEANRRF